MQYIFFTLTQKIMPRVVVACGMGKVQDQMFEIIPSEGDVFTWMQEAKSKAVVVYA